MRQHETGKRLRTVAAILLALAAVATALVAARGPAIPERATYEWPPKHLPGGTPTRFWTTPLLLARHYPESLDARIPCGPARSLSGNAPPTTLLATMRDPARSNGLEVRRTAIGEIAVTVGRADLATFARAGSPSECVLHLSIVGRNWSISEAGRSSRRGMLAAPPSVAGLITALDLRAEPGLEVTVRPIPQDTRPSERQTLMRILTAVLLVAAILLLLPLRRPVLRRRKPGALTAPDGFVAVSLLVWLVLEPVLFDDGWVRARQTNALLSGGFSNYYDQYGGNLPLLTWLEWLQQFVVAHSSALVVDRLPAVVALLAVWLVCRSCLVRLIGEAPRRGNAAWWSAAATFVVGAVAFGITLRPEPFIALLVVGVFACCQRYIEAPSLGPLIGAVLLGCLAVTAHPTGAVAFAPLLVCLPRVWRDSRATGPVRRRDLAGVVVIGIAWTLLLAFLDSDIASRRENVELTRLGGEHSDGILHEFNRYRDLNSWASPVLRREFVALLLLAAVGLLASRFWRRGLLESLPSASVLAGLGLLALSPSKWVHHFGVFIGLAVVAIGVEAAGLTAQRMSTARRWCMVGLFVCVTAWAAGLSQPWGPLDGIDWGRVPFLATALTACAVVVLVGAARRSRRTASIMIPVVLVTLLGLTTSVFAARAITVDRWSPAGQALGDLTGQDACGLADDLHVPDPASMRELRPANSANADASAGGRTLFRSQKPGRESWYWLPRSPVGVFLVGMWRPQDELQVVWGKKEIGRIHLLSSGSANLHQAQPGPNGTPRRFVAEWSLPKRPPDANVVMVRTASAGRRAAISTRPIAYRGSKLTSLLNGGNELTLVSPFLFAAIPCSGLPRLTHGSADAPRLVIESSLPASPAVSRPSSPFLGLPETMDVWRVPVRSRWIGWEEYVDVYAVRADPRDAIAPIVMRATS